MVRPIIRRCLAFESLHLTDAAFASQRKAAEERVCPIYNFALCRREERGITPALSATLALARNGRFARHSGMNHKYRSGRPIFQRQFLERLLHQVRKLVG